MITDLQKEKVIQEIALKNYQLKQKYKLKGLAKGGYLFEPDISYDFEEFIHYRVKPSYVSFETEDNCCFHIYSIEKIQQELENCIINKKFNEEERENVSTFIIELQELRKNSELYDYDLIIIGISDYDCGGTMKDEEKYHSQFIGKFGEFWNEKEGRNPFNRSTLLAYHTHESKPFENEKGERYDKFLPALSELLDL